MGTELEDASLQKDARTFAIANVATEETKCSIFEIDPKPVNILIGWI